MSIYSENADITTCRKLSFEKLIILQLVKKFLALDPNLSHKNLIKFLTHTEGPTARVSVLPCHLKTEEDPASETL
jgi:hypothetical protein